MQLKKEVLRKRMQKQLDRINEKRLEYELSFKTYKEQYLEALKADIASLEKATNWEEHQNRHHKPYPHTPYSWESDNNQREKIIKRNMAILDAIEGDMIDVTALKTGRGITLETIFDE